MAAINSESESLTHMQERVLLAISTGEDLEVIE